MGGTDIEPIIVAIRFMNCLLMGRDSLPLEMLNILEGYDIGSLKHNSPEYLHLLIEAKKAAFSDRDHFITDPEFEKIPVDELLSKDYAGKIREGIDSEQGRASLCPSLCNRSSRYGLCDGRR